MGKKRIVLLLGAGAALSWGGPSTQELLELIKKNNDIKTASGENVISYFVNLLNKSYDNSVSVNFETVISLLEVLFEYYYNESICGNTPDLHPVWPNIFNIDNNIDRELFGHYRIETPHLTYNIIDNEDTVEIWDKNNLINKLPCTISRWKVVVLHNIYSSIIKTISDRIKEYDDKVFNNKDQSSVLLIKFVTFLNKRSYISRFYSTNYDKLLPAIFKDKVSVIDGFYESDNNKIKAFNPKKTMTNFESFCYYNLHGSIYWHTHISNKTFNDELVSLDSPQFSEFGASHIPVDNAKEVLFYKILVGNNKTQKIKILPLNYFESIFSQDCNNSDFLFIIGSSLNDYDIKNSIALSLYDEDKVLVIITKVDTTDIIKIKKTIKSISPLPERSNIIKCNNLKEWFANKEHNSYVYINGFDKFLSTEAWNELKILSSSFQYKQ